MALRLLLPCTCRDVSGDLLPVEAGEDVRTLKSLVQRHLKHTGSEVARCVPPSSRRILRRDAYTNQLLKRPFGHTCLAAFVTLPCPLYLPAGGCC
jgi:hypothetical protein